MSRKAIVIGGSISGLLSARVMSDYFDEVTIIEKDSFKKTDAIRNGTPQANHIHLLLVKGRQILQEFFPDFEDILIKKGANKIDFLGDGRYLLPTGWAPQFNSGIVSLTCSRKLLEETIREETLKIPNITVQKKQIDSFSFLNSRIFLHSSGDEFSADLVADCTGRHTKTPKWFENAGLPKIEETRVDSFVGYATRRYVIPNSSEKKLKLLVILNKPTSNPKAGILYPIEDGKWLVGLSSIGGSHPPVDEKGFLEFTKNLESNELYDSIKDATPDSEIFGYQIQGSRKFHYEHIVPWPKNFIVLGDAVSVFNPFYGQGMTSAALGTKVLQKMFKNQKFDDSFTKKFQKNLAKEISIPWILGTSEDLRWPTTKGNKPNFITRLVQNHAQKVLLLGPKSQIATQSFLEMMHMIKSPTVLFHPRILLQLFFDIKNNKS